MVSFHRVSVFSYLIIKRIYSTFRFKCGVDFEYLLEGCGKTYDNYKRYNAPHLDSMGTRTDCA